VHVNTLGEESKGMSHAKKNRVRGGLVWESNKKIREKGAKACLWDETEGEEARELIARGRNKG